jgi:site-specific DNA-methyltransferase (adenine-specific)/site-specific DNA-methyltransferase (cytosine-N4-specific)
MDAPGLQSAFQFLASSPDPLKSDERMASNGTKLSGGALPAPKIVNSEPSPFRFAFERGRSGIVIGDARQLLRTFPENAFRCCITSPPYWGLRDYGIAGQIGAEMELNQYIEHVTAVFREVRRVLVDDGSLWLNIGDAYTSGNRTWRDADKKNPARGMSYRAPTPEGLKPKDLIGIPWKLAFALQQDGWYLRSDIIWYKPNCQPESVKDRPTRSHEYVFLLTKSEDYYYDSAAIREQAQTKSGTRNKRTVWSVNTEPFPDAHFATFPPSLIEPMVLAGTEPDDLILDPFFGSGTVGSVCQNLNRRFVGIELKAEFADIALNRLGWKDVRNESKRKRISGLAAGTSDFTLISPTVPAGPLSARRAQGHRRG